MFPRRPEAAEGESAGGASRQPWAPSGLVVQLGIKVSAVGGGGVHLHLDAETQASPSAVLSSSLGVGTAWTWGQPSAGSLVQGAQRVCLFPGEAGRQLHKLDISKQQKCVVCEFGRLPPGSQLLWGLRAGRLLSSAPGGPRLSWLLCLQGHDFPCPRSGLPLPPLTRTFVTTFRASPG